MARPATGTAFTSRGVHFAVVALGGGKRLARAVPKAVTLEDARARARFATELCASLTRAGHTDLHEKIVDLVVEADGAARLEAIAAKVAGLCGGELVRVVKPAAPTGPAALTFKDAADLWTSGKLHTLHPDHVRAKRSAADDEQRLSVLAKEIGGVPIAAFSLDDAERAMRTLPAGLEPATRRHYAQAMRRLLQLCVYPLRLIRENPLPRGFLPRVARGAKAKSFVYPDEEAKLLGCAKVPLGRRMLLGFLFREGARASEAAGLEWTDLDLEHGLVHLDENKTDDPRTWALGPDVARALAQWRRLNPRARYVFGESEPPKIGHLADEVRDALQLAGVTREALFERGPTRLRLRAHDLRTTFVTLALASGRTEDWVTDRTGHVTSDQLYNYRSWSRAAVEAKLGWFAAMDSAIPELLTIQLSAPLGKWTPEADASTQNDPQSRSGGIGRRSGFKIRRGIPP